MSLHDIDKNLNRKEKREKKIFSLRLDQDLIRNINRLSEELDVSKTKIARSYIQLSDYFFLEPNLELKTFTKMSLSIFPKDILKDLLHSLSEKDKISIGDKLGTIINNNSQVIGLNTIEEKRKLIQGLNWIKFTPVHLIVKIKNEKDPKAIESTSNEGQFWGIPKEIWPIETIHALIFRLLYNQRYNSNWETNLLKKFLNQPEKNLKKNSDFNKNRDFLLKFKNEIGCRKENFESEHIYYYYEIFRIN